MVEIIIPSTKEEGILATKVASTEEEEVEEVVTDQEVVVEEDLGVDVDVDCKQDSFPYFIISISSRLLYSSIFINSSSRMND